MPELPEVETVRRMVSPHIIGHTIVSITISKTSVIARPSADEFTTCLVGDAFLDSSRRGKYLIFYMKSGRKLILHLRMTGCLIAFPPENTFEPHTHVIFKLDNGWNLCYSDTRRFGRFWLFDTDEKYDCGIEKLGPEPFDACVTGKYLRSKIGSSSRSIKECLLDQTVIAGIGNIYSDEILFRTHILPTRNANTLDCDEWEALATNIGLCMKFFVEMNEISDEDYIHGHGKDYRNTPYLSVYGHAGCPCPVCGEKLIRKTVGQRGSVFCKHCQN